MEANFFRFLAGELQMALTGQRIEKVHGPADDVTVLTLHGQGRKTHLIIRPAKTAGLLFFSTQRPANPLAAPARVMWLRRRLTGRRLLSARVDWPALRLALALSPRDVPAAGQWLVLDLRSGLTLEDDFPSAQEPSWPALPRILDEADIWREHPQLTPPLRKRLATLARTDPGKAARLLERLASGNAEGFFLPPGAPPLAWDSGQDGTERHATAMEAARVFGERTLFTQLALAEDTPALDQAAQARKRLKRQLDLLDRDEERHRALTELAIPAEALQIALSSLKATPQQPVITLEHPEHGPQQVPLDPRQTPAENMARLFLLAAKGRRGLAHVARRRQLLLAGAGPELRPTAPDAPGTRRPPGAPQATPLILPKRYQGLAVACFRTTDGFLVLRGKSSQANHDMLSRAASPHDYWLHASGGPSAHVILRRDYPDQPVPEQSLLEAAGLCALKSYRKDDAKAEVLLARVRDVRKVKGAAMGSVAVDQVERTLLVALDQGLEKRLALSLNAAARGAAPGPRRGK